MIVYFARPEIIYVCIGLGLLLTGETIRIWSVSYAGVVQPERGMWAQKSYVRQAHTPLLETRCMLAICLCM